MLNPAKFHTALAGAALVAAATTLAAPAFAHHSYSMFDKTQTMTIQGTVRTWELVNPHSYLWVVVQKGNDTQIWGIEGGGVTNLMRAGLKKSSVQPGDKITVAFHPMRDGRTGGNLIKVVLADGKEINFGGGEDSKQDGAAGGNPAQ